MSRPTLVLTIGHSNRPLDEFLGLLQGHSVDCLVDVRSIPWSRHNPQFNRETFAGALKADGIGYEHAADLGGFRRAAPDSPNAGWRNASFRGYADYMQTAAFSTGLERVMHEAQTSRLVLMCAEAVPWRCHRSLIADALVARDVRVEEILSATRTQTHAMTSFARVVGTTVIYPPQANDH